MIDGNSGSLAERDSLRLLSLEFSLSLNSVSLGLWGCPEYFAVPTTGACHWHVAATEGTRRPMRALAKVPAFKVARRGRGMFHGRPPAGTGTWEVHVPQCAPHPPRRGAKADRTTKPTAC